MLLPQWLWRALSRVHYWASLLFGIQVLIWIGTGLYFAATPIERVRGEHLRHAHPTAVVATGIVTPEAAAAAVNASPAEISLKQVDGRPVYLVTDTAGVRALVDAATGVKSASLDAAAASRIAAGVYAGKGVLQEATFLAVAPQEYPRPGPVFAVAFGPADAATIYVDATSGEARVVRIAEWRLYDFLWGLHIMDWTSRENFNSLHLIGFAVGAFVLSVTGVGLALARSLRRRRTPRGV